MKNKKGCFKRQMALVIACIMLTTAVSPVCAMTQDTTVEWKPLHTVKGLPDAKDDQIFPDSSNRKLSRSELEGLTKAQAQECINDIYARHGYIFKDPEIKAHYDSQSWYAGKTSDAAAVEKAFNSTERDNIKLLKEYKDTAPDVHGGIVYQGDGFTLVLPDVWQGNYVIEENYDGDMNSIVFNEKTNHDYWKAHPDDPKAGTGKVFSIVWRKQEMQQAVCYGSKNGYYYYFIPASDVRYHIENETLKNNYEALFKTNKQVRDSFAFD